MCRFTFVLCLLGCGTDLRPSQDDRPDAGVAGGPKTDGGTSTTTTDANGDGGAGVADGMLANLTPCEQAIYHADYQFLEDQVFTVSCINGCHSGASPGAGMDLTVGRAYGSLVNVPSTQFGGWTRVVPNDPAASMLMVQVGGEPGPELEGFMPWGQPRLCDPLIDAMRRWILAGAPRS